MLTASAEAHFGGRSDIARALKGSRTIAAVYQWGEVVPRAAALKLADLSAGKLTVDESLYNEFGHIKRPDEAA
jgi:hypothetical protein